MVGLNSRRSVAQLLEHRHIALSRRATSQYGRVVEERELASPDPPLQSWHVRLRRFRTSDARRVADACQDPLIPRYMFMKEGLTEYEARMWIERSNEEWPSGRARLAVVDPPTDRVIGQVGMAVHWDDATPRCRAEPETQ
jgi:RimJ/RimL family protein N-acetyltransferase